MSGLEGATYYVNEFAKSYSLDDRTDWIGNGFALASLGEDGRSLFHTICRTSSKYEYNDTDKKFSELLSNHDGSKNIESFFYDCIHNLNITPPKMSVNTNTISVNNNQVVKPDYKEDKLVINPKDPNDKWIFTLDEVMSAVPEPRLWHFFLKGAMNAIVASSEAGKTTFVRNITNAIINAESKFLGWNLRCKRNQVIIVSTEDGLHSHKEHFERMNTNLDERVGDVRFIIDSHNLISKLDVALKDRPADIVFIDTWGDAVSGDYDNKMTRGFLKEIRTVCMKHGTTPVVIHHTNKGADNIPHKSSIKGAGDFEQALRSVLFLTVYEERRYLGLVKGNDHNEEDRKWMYQVDYNQDTEHISIDHQNRVERQSIINELNREKFGSQNIKDLQWDAVFEGSAKRHSEMVNCIKNQFGFSESGAKNRIKEAKANGDISYDENTRMYSEK